MQLCDQNWHSLATSARLLSSPEVILRSLSWDPLLSSHSSSVLEEELGVLGELFQKKLSQPLSEKLKHI